MATLYFALRLFDIKHNLNANTIGESLRDGSWYSGSVRTDTRASKQLHKHFKARNRSRNQTTDVQNLLTPV